MKKIVYTYFNYRKTHSFQRVGFNHLIRLLFVPSLKTFWSTRIAPGTSCLFRNHTISFKSVFIRFPILLHFIIIVPLSGSLKILYSLSESKTRCYRFTRRINFIIFFWILRYSIFIIVNVGLNLLSSTLKICLRVSAFLFIFCFINKYIK